MVNNISQFGLNKYWIK